MDRDQLERIRDEIEELSSAGDDGSALSPIANDFDGIDAVDDDLRNVDVLNDLVLDAYAEPFPNIYARYEVSLTEAMDACDAVLRGNGREADAAVVSMDAAAKEAQALHDACAEAKADADKRVDEFCDVLRESLHESVSHLDRAARREAHAYADYATAIAERLRRALDV